MSAKYVGNMIVFWLLICYKKHPTFNVRVTINVYWFINIPNFGAEPRESQTTLFAYFWSFIFIEIFVNWNLDIISKITAHSYYEEYYWKKLKSGRVMFETVAKKFNIPAFIINVEWYFWIRRWKLKNSSMSGQLPRISPNTLFVWSQFCFDNCCKIRDLSPFCLISCVFIKSKSFFWLLILIQGSCWKMGSIINLFEIQIYNRKKDRVGEKRALIWDFIKPLLKQFQFAIHQ